MSECYDGRAQSGVQRFGEAKPGWWGVTGQGGGGAGDAGETESCLAPLQSLYPSRPDLIKASPVWAC